MHTVQRGRWVSGWGTATHFGQRSKQDCSAPSRGEVPGRSGWPDPKQQASPARAFFFLPSTTANLDGRDTASETPGSGEVLGVEAGLGEGDSGGGAVAELAPVQRHACQLGGGGVHEGEEDLTHAWRVAGGVRGVWAGDDHLPANQTQRGALSVVRGAVSGRCQVAQSG